MSVTRQNTQRKRLDPGGLEPYQKQFNTEIYKRFREVKGVVRETVEEDDALNLSTNLQSRSGFPEPVGESFLNWLTSALDEMIDHQELEHFITSAYRRGLMHANIELNQSGLSDDTLEDEVDRGDRAQIRATTGGIRGGSILDVGRDTSLAPILNRKKHRRQLRVIKNRSKEGLEKIKNDIIGEASRLVQEELLATNSKRTLANSINEVIDKIGIKRGKTHGLTVTAMAHAEATLERFHTFRDFVESVKLQAEYSTAGDGDVCEICRPFDNRNMSISKARGLIPQHPRCRCVWSVVLEF
jgi:hypothetical protein